MRLLRPVRAQARERAAESRLRIRPLRPPLHGPERVAELDRDSGDPAFITGNGIAARCRYVLNNDALTENRDVDNNWWFCKADFLDYFFRSLAPRDDFVLFSHNSDESVTSGSAGRLRRRELVAWFAQNADYRHPKLFALPLGIANPSWPHGDPAELHRAQAAPLSKTSLFDASFDPHTNPAERLRCIEHTGLEPGPKRPFPEYLAALRASYFCIAPRGNGIDTHRVWEALYLGTIPVVTRSVLTEQHPDLPLVVLDDWSDFSAADFSPEVYERVWGGWDPAAIGLDPYLERVRAILGR